MEGDHNELVLNPRVYGLKLLVTSLRLLIKCIVFHTVCMKESELKRSWPEPRIRK